MINFEWYRSSIEVYRVGTVSGAAQVLHLTQPAVSQHVAARESALEIPCFKGLRGGWFPRKRDKDFILKLLVRQGERI